MNEQAFVVFFIPFEPAFQKPAALTETDAALFIYLFFLNLQAEPCIKPAECQVLAITRPRFAFSPQLETATEQLKMLILFFALNSSAISLLSFSPLSGYFIPNGATVFRFIFQEELVLKYG